MGLVTLVPLFMGALLCARSVSMSTRSALKLLLRLAASPQRFCTRNKLVTYYLQVELASQIVKLCDLSSLSLFLRFR
jgi:hypothetical protein